MAKKKKIDPRINAHIREYTKFAKATGDHDWDWAYLLRIIQFKLDRMAMFFRKNGSSMDRDVCAKEMEKASELLKLVIEDKYESKHISLLPPSHTSKQFVAACKAGFKDKQADLDKALKIISKNCFCWWD